MSHVGAKSIQDNTTAVINAKLPMLRSRPNALAAINSVAEKGLKE
jgi:hypothetical protein